MDENQNAPQRPKNPRRKQKTKAQIFKEAYLPLIIAAVAVILILVFIIGAVVRSVRTRNAEEAAAQAAAAEAARIRQELLEEEAQLLDEAADLAETYDYEGAINTLNQFRGDLSEFPTIATELERYIEEKNQLVAWDDPNEVINLSFQLLIADPSRTFNNSDYGYTFNRSFITTEEFMQILDDLYANGYVLVSPDDLFETGTAPDGTPACSPKVLYLPEGKQPLILTQTNVNYNYYLIDSDGDKIPDKNGGGFGTKLVLHGDTLLCEMISSSGQTVTGAYDMIPILEAYLKEHPDFSYRGAKATIAITGYNGLFGYRTEPSSRELYGEDAYNQSVDYVQQICQWLRDNGYHLSFYTYGNIAYGEIGYSQVQEDLNRWNNEVVPIVGQLDSIVFAQNSDLTTSLSYSGDKYELLRDNGFRYFVGFCTDGESWANVAAEYVRQGRIMVNGATIAHHPEWFEGIFNTDNLLDPSRGTVPTW